MHFKRTFRTTVRASKEYTNLLFLKKIEPLLNTKRRRPKKDAHKNKKLNFKKKRILQNNEHYSAHMDASTDNIPFQRSTNVENEVI